MPCLEPTRRKHCTVASVIMSHQRSQHLRCTSSDVSSTQLPASPRFSYLQLLKIKTSSQQLDQNFSRSFPRFCCPEDQDLPGSALLWAPTRTGTFRHLVLLQVEAQIWPGPTSDRMRTGGLQSPLARFKRHGPKGIKSASTTPLSMCSDLSWNKCFVATSVTSAGYPLKDCLLHHLLWSRSLPQQVTIVNLGISDS